MGLDNQSLTAFIINFGVSKPFSHTLTNSHGTHRASGLIGMPAFTFINSHLSLELGQQDDLESLVYVLIYLSFGSLPWLQSNKCNSRSSKQNSSTILEHK